MRVKQSFQTCLPLLLLAALLAGNARAALLDLGPTVPAVVGSTPPTLGHGFPLWYRDTNRVPLELCTNEAMCLFVRPNPLAPVSFPTNIPNELFYFSADASMTTPGGTALLVSGVEGNILTNTDGSLNLISFARVRIRVDTNVAGTYVVTTPYKQYTFTNVPVGTRAINFTEDIGIGPNGVFTGALSGSIGPFLYCSDAPFPATDGTGGSYIGHNATTCKVLGSTFPSAQNPSNFFRIQGPAGFGTVTTTDFTVTGKIYTEVTPTPLTVDKATYALDSTGMQVNAFATSQALSNQVNGALPFPANFALTGAPTVLQLTGTGIPTQNLATNNPADGKFFSDSGLFTTPGSIPASATVTNTADTPPVVKTVPLVDEVVIDKAAYNPLTGTLSITASSLDRVAAPPLKAFLPGMTAPLGTLSNGQLNITFPFTDNSGPQPKTYTIPASTIEVTSAKGGSATASVATFNVKTAFTITSADAPNGSISPAGVTAVLPGSNQTYTITPNAGFQIANLVVDGVILPAATSYTFTSITGTHTISASFTNIASNFTITAAAGLNGSISPAGANVVAGGSNQTITITPNAGFVVTALVVDGTELPGATSYTFSNVTANHYINAYFGPIATTVTITSAAGPNGSITPAGANAVPGGSSQTYTITPNAGFVVSALVVDGTELPGATSYTFSNVTANHYINAYFGP